MQLLAESNVADFSSGVELFPFARSIRGEAGRVGRERETRLGFRKFILPHHHIKMSSTKQSVQTFGKKVRRFACAASFNGVNPTSG